jgi:hypothetical protein
MTSYSLIPISILRAPYIRILVLGTTSILEDNIPGPTNCYKYLATLPAQLLLESAIRGTSRSQSHLLLLEILDIYIIRFLGYPSYRLIVLVGPDKILLLYTWLDLRRWYFLLFTPL